MAARIHSHRSRCSVSLVFLATLVLSPFASGQIIQTTIVDIGLPLAAGGGTGASMATVDGRPAAVAFNGRESSLMYYSSTQADGLGTWQASEVDGDLVAGSFASASLAVVNGRPAVAYVHNGPGELRFAVNQEADGSGAWAVQTLGPAQVITGAACALEEVAGHPAVCYIHSNTQRLLFSRNTQPDGAGAWITAEVTGSGIQGNHVALAVIAGFPAISYRDNTSPGLKFAMNSAPDGTGAWSVFTVDPIAGTGYFASLAEVAGTPAISYSDGTALDLKFARCSTADGSGTWTTVTVDSAGSVGRYSGLTIVDGAPAISYYDLTLQDLKLARNSAADGSGAWSVQTVEDAGDSGQYAAPGFAGGRPAIVYWDYTESHLEYTINALEDGSGAWTTVRVDGAAAAGNVRFAGPQVLVEGHPAVCYYDEGAGVLRFARNSLADGTGEWVRATVDDTPLSGRDASMAVVAGFPVIAYIEGGTGFLKFARNAAADGSGAWTTGVVDSAAPAFFASIAEVNGTPGIAYQRTSTADLRFARNASADGTGAWSTVAVATGGDSGNYCALAIVAGNPAIIHFNIGGGLVYHRNTNATGGGSWGVGVTLDSLASPLPASLAVVNGTPAVAYTRSGRLRFARSSTAAGGLAGNWSTAEIDPALTTSGGVSLTVIAGRPALALQRPSLQDLVFARCSNADGTGAWTFVTVETTGDTGFQPSLLATGESAGISYVDLTSRDLRWARVRYPGELTLLAPGGGVIAPGGSWSMIAAAGTATDAVFTLHNTGFETITALQYTTDGTDGPLFSAASPAPLPLAGGTSTGFTLRYAPPLPGNSTATLTLASPAPEVTPFLLNLTGTALSFHADGDTDGLSDASEFQMAALGFDWQIAQPALVGTLLNHAAGAGLFTQQQIQNLNPGIQLLTRDATNGLFTLKLGLGKSTDLQNFTPFPFLPAQTTVNPQGEVEFRFGVPDNTQFFRLLPWP